MYFVKLKWKLKYNYEAVTWVTSREYYGYNVSFGMCLCTHGVHVYMQICLRVGECTYTYLCGGLRPESGVLLNCSPPYSLRKGLSLNRELTVWVSLVSLLPLSLLELYAVCPVHQAFTWVLGSWILALVLLWEVLYPLNHLPSSVMIILIAVCIVSLSHASSSLKYCQHSALTYCREAKTVDS